MKQEEKQKLPLIPLTRDKFDTLGMIVTDPMGSYTGRPTDVLDTPIQDVDDL